MIVIYLCHVLAVATFIAAAALGHIEHKRVEQNRTESKHAVKKRRKSKMKTNYDPNNGEQIEGKSIHDVMAAARVRFGGNYLVMNTQTYNDPHWKAVYNMAKGDGGLSSHERRKNAPRSLSEGGKILM
ncbi:hypothetical protein [Bacillus wiedmannii]|uniref:hypothetical protein n=1 Tax=Bacillus wiedmannii TaxID=1890302 RepID=UPI001D0EC6BC|nr:hypothetical protein [Bacillus wiedmannii]MCC2327982.1 hypothetical protein [Bacillus wiedmannii]